ncbi:MAG: lipid-A-disaccharide synthase N-terminal domain-containing protein [Salegentibacter sp.]|uniref:Lipid A Biosynthesis N-terminal domain-containing protein n=1 Tax=Salegentibacter flavus TaxID=287099 RepID=A0A1I4ZG77_9FLAO|nr:MULTISPECIES: lipid-A-disaccharide synthase N-terminal domain-containing protein [Salegentibacter]MDR9456756.1 lipid-A-disaccharide synthase N-terminal domain-containing protein [Salegentibacter sp.]SFN49271.1 Lipid A Biosynthesis N-terminal domain-containing protein [Salegentibacter flavus]
MENWQIYAIGFTAQILFSARLLHQWLLSEKLKMVVTPTLFWKLSLFASFLLFVYGYFRDDFAIMFGQGITYFIYIRNLYLQGTWQRLPSWLQWLLYLFPIGVISFFITFKSFHIDKLFLNEDIPFWLLALGTSAQIIFNLRFIYQWFYSEKIRQSVLPLGFWVLSLFGASLILIYAILRQDPVLFIGHILGSFIYVRNIVLSLKTYA